MKRKIIEIDKEKCDGCGQCSKACHEGAIRVISGKAELVSDIYCDGLGACVGECPKDAIKIVEKDTSAIEKPCVCPGVKAMSFSGKSDSHSESATGVSSELSQWPIQLKLIPVNAPFWENASVLLAADCSAFALGNFHSTLLKGKKLAIACPKLDDSELYIEKLAEIFSQNNIKNVTVAHMEVPCCGGLVKVTEEAVEKSKKNIPIIKVKLSLDGKIASIN